MIAPRRPLFRCLTAALVWVAVAGCSGDPTATTATVPADAATFSYAGITGATEAIVDDWGEETGFAVLLLAFDAGYTIEQVVATPELTQAGTIAGVEPADAPLGLLEDPPAGVGDQALAHQGLFVLQELPDWDPNETLIDSFDNTIREVFIAAEQRLEELRSQQAQGSRLITIVATLAARGYLVDQIIEAFIFGEVDADLGADPQLGIPVPCYSIVTEPEVLPVNQDLLAGSCPPLGSESVDEETTTTTQPADTEEPDAGEGDEFVGSVDAAATGADPDLVLINSVLLVAGADLTGTIELLGNAAVEGFDDSAGFCFHLKITLAPGSVLEAGDGSYEGTADAQGGLGDGPCPGGPPDVEPTFLTVEVTASIAGDTLTGVLANAGEEPITFTATRR